MAFMRNICLLALALLTSPVFAQTPQPTEAAFRKSLRIGPEVTLDYRNIQCQPVNFEGFVADMRKPGAGASVDRAIDGSAVTMSVTLKGRGTCPSPYSAVTEMPPFDLKDLNGKRVTSGSLRGKPTLISFYFATCIPCILEVEPLNRYAAARPHMNFLSVTFDDRAETQAFVKRYGVRWRVVPDAQELVERMRVKQFPMLALFDANGRLLGTKKGGARDELEAANVEPQVKRWVDGLLKK